LNDEPTAPVESVLDAVARGLQHPAANDRAFALHWLGMLAPSTATALALPLLQDEAVDVRVACCACLGAIRDQNAIPSLIAVLHASSASRIRTAALLGVENYYAAEIGELLLDLLAAGVDDPVALSVLCRQLWKYPSARTIASLQRTLTTAAKLPHRPVVEATLEFVQRVASH
jgi:HEAT repeat protein